LHGPGHVAGPGLGFERGEALISSNNNKVPVVVKASKIEKEMITTDRAELEAILKERQKQTHTA
jgi:hypothetical protein